MSATVTQAMIVEGLRDLGVRTGGRIMVHSSLRSFGRVDGGGATVIAALCEAVGDSGTVMMPSFNHGAPFTPEGSGIYDPTQTPTMNGAVPDAFWRMPGVLRSLNPTHPFAAWGAAAHRYTDYHHRTLTMGPGSPLALLAEDDGWCLMIGTDHRTNTFKHVVETTLRAPCIGLRTEAYPVRLPDGRTAIGRTWGWRSQGCPLTGSGAYIAREMDARGFHRKTRIGSAHVTAFRLSDCFEAVRDVLQNGRDRFPPCSRCPIRPRVRPANCPSDWDEDRNALKPDSCAWTY